MDNDYQSYFIGKLILITGASGLVGTELTKKLIGLGARLRLVYNQHVPQLSNLSNIELISGNLLQKDFCEQIVQDVDYVFHCSASTSGAAAITHTPLIHVTPNLIMNAQLFEAAYNAGVKKCLWLSSTTGYPDRGDMEITEDQMFLEDPPEKYFPVGWMKRYTEVLCRMYSEYLPRKMTCIVLRPTNIYGPGDKFDPATSHVLPALIRKVVNQENPLVVWGTGDEVRNLIYVSDMVRAMLLAISKLDHFEPLNIGYTKSISVKELVKLILLFENSTLSPIYDPSMPTMIAKRYFDCTKAKQLIGFECEVPIEEGIKSTIQWYKYNKEKCR